MQVDGKRPSKRLSGRHGGGGRAGPRDIAATADPDAGVDTQLLRPSSASLSGAHVSRQA